MYINDSFFKPMQIWEMHRDTNVNLYPMNTFFKSMHHIVNFYANVRMWISESYQL